MERRVVEHWSNNRWGWGRRTVKLLVTEAGWEVYALSGLRSREWTLVYGSDEEAARDQVEELLTDPELGPWKQLTVR